jgi:hypothetical protein
VEQLRAYDSLIVICGKNHTATPELPMMAGQRSMTLLKDYALVGNNATAAYAAIFTMKMTPASSIERSFVGIY